MLSSRQRLDLTLRHQQPDRVCVDVGATRDSTVQASTLSKLRAAVLGASDHRVRVLDEMMMVGEVDEELRRALPIDVIGVWGAGNLFGIRNNDWKPWELFDGTPVLVPGAFNPSVDEHGDLLMYPAGDRSALPCARMPKDGFYFDPIVRQEPIDENRLDPGDRADEFRPLTGMELAEFVAEARLATQTDYGVLANLPGITSYGDPVRITGPGLRQPKGVRDPEEWFVSFVTRKDYVKGIFELQTEVALANIRRLAAALGHGVQVARVCGTDFGMQEGLFISRDTYRELFSPCYRQVNALIHELTDWKTFKHCCGSVYDLIPDFIEDGFDILNPVQTSAAKMDPKTLKREFGDRIVFWGGGVDTQKTLPFGTPEEVYRQVRQRIDIFNDGGGYVFGAIHNIQHGVPVVNLLAMFQAIRDSWDT